MDSLNWIAFEIGVNIFQSFLYLYFFKNRLGIPKGTKGADVLCVVSYTTFLTSYLFFDIPVSDCVGGLIYFIYLRFVSNEKWSTCALWVIFKEVVAVSTIGLMLQVCLTSFSIPYEVIMSSNKYRVIFVLSTNFVLFIEIFFFSKAKRTTSTLHWSALILFLLTNISLLIVIETIFSLQIQEVYPTDSPFLLSYAFLILCSVFSVSLFYLMTSISERAYHAQIALNHVKQTKEHQLVIQDMYANMLKQQHDSRHHIQTLEQLILSGNSNAAKAYLDDYKSQIAKQEGYLTGSVAVDALLTAKSITCKNNGIELQLEQCPLNHLPISEIDFCAIVGNLLDNAMEGCMRIKPPNKSKWISLTFSRVWNMFTIRCENPATASAIVKHNNIFLTSKSQTSETHGLGIPSIISIAEKADGFCSFEVQNNTFISIVTLPYPSEEN